MPKDHMDKLYNSKNPLIRFVLHNRLKAILHNLPPGNNLKILDAGCGEGHLLQKIYSKNKNNDYYGIDISTIALKKAKERCRFAKFKKMNMLKISFPADYFDVVICSDALEHISDYKKAFAELKKTLKNSGYLIITFPNETIWTLCRFLLGRRPVKLPDHINSFKPSQIRSFIGMKPVLEFGLPFKLPFSLSPSYLMKFKKG